MRLPVHRVTLEYRQQDGVLVLREVVAMVIDVTAAATFGYRGGEVFELERGPDGSWLCVMTEVTGRSCGEVLSRALARRFSGRKP